MSQLTVSTDVPTEITMTRTFQAPRRLVIKAMTTPELIERWLGGVRSTVKVAAFDHRVGGRYRYEFALPDGGDFTFSGVFREISDDRIVYTEAFNGDDANAAEVITTFVERDGKTTMTVTMRFASQELRDRVVGTGMAEGAGESYDQLESVIATL